MSTAGQPETNPNQALWEKGELHPERGNDAQER